MCPAAHISTHMQTQMLFLFQPNLMLVIIPLFFHPQSFSLKRSRSCLIFISSVLLDYLPLRWDFFIWFNRIWDCCMSFVAICCETKCLTGQLVCQMDIVCSNIHLEIRGCRLSGMCCEIVRHSFQPSDETHWPQASETSVYVRFHHFLSVCWKHQHQAAVVHLCWLLFCVTVYC